MNKPLTDAELVILGMVAETPRHGYELEQLIEERGIREWVSLGFSSIYYLLDKLETKGLVSSIRPPSAKGRKIFNITPGGRSVCTDAVRDAITTIQPINSSLLVGIANSPLLDQREFQSALRKRAAQLEHDYQTISATKAAQQPLPDFVEAIFDYNLGVIKAEQIWLKKLVSQEEPMDKIDFKKELKHLYAPTDKDFTVVDVPPMSYLMVDGQGNPNTTKSYKEAVEALYSVSYALKFASKKQVGRDYAVLPLEGLWTADDMTAFTSRDKDAWKWTMMIMQPDWITSDMVSDALETVMAKKGLPALTRLYFEEYDEGKCVQIMHIGSYDDEAPTLHRLHAEYLPENNLAPTGRHHEIYIGDPRKSEPSKLKTILRQPVKDK